MKLYVEAIFNSKCPNVNNCIPTIVIKIDVNILNIPYVSVYFPRLPSCLIELLPWE